LTLDLIACPTCGGERVNHALACGTDGCRFMEMVCYRCNGEGVVPRAMEQWIADGERLRQRRVEELPYRNQRTESARLGIDVVRLSRLEQGLEPGGAALLEMEAIP